MNTTKIRLRLDWPPVALSPNSRVYWAQKYVASQSYKYEAKIMALQAMGRERLRFHGPVTMTLTFCLKDRSRKHDIDNLIAMMKPAIDGIVDSGLIEDDSSEYLTYGIPTLVLNSDRRCVYVDLEGTL